MRKMDQLEIDKLSSDERNELVSFLEGLTSTPDSITALRPALAETRLFTREEVNQVLKGLSRDPFREILALMLSGHPDQNSIALFAQRNPDRWAQATAVFARLAGYHDKLEITTNVYLAVQRLGDSDLEAKLAEMEALLASEQPPTIDQLPQPTITIQDDRVKQELGDPLSAEKSRSDLSRDLFRKTRRKLAREV